MAEVDNLLCLVSQLWSHEGKNKVLNTGEQQSEDPAEVTKIKVGFK